MEIYKDQYVIRELDESGKILHTRWLPSTDLMDAQTFRDAMLGLANQIEKRKVQFLLSDLRQLHFTITPSLQLWIAQTIAPKFLQAGLERQAIVVPADLFSKVSLEQTIEEVEQAMHRTQFSKFFQGIEEAKKWLIG